MPTTRNTKRKADAIEHADDGSSSAAAAGARKGRQKRAPAKTKQRETDAKDVSNDDLDEAGQFLAIATWATSSTSKNNSDVQSQVTEFRGKVANLRQNLGKLQSEQLQIIETLEREHCESLKDKTGQLCASRSGKAQAAAGDAGLPIPTDHDKTIAFIASGRKMLCTYEIASSSASQLRFDTGSLRWAKDADDMRAVLDSMHREGTTIARSLVDLQEHLELPVAASDTRREVDKIAAEWSQRYCEAVEDESWGTTAHRQWGILCSAARSAFRLETAPSPGGS